MSEGFERGRIAGIRQSSVFLLHEVTKMDDDASQELLSFAAKTADALTALAAQIEAGSIAADPLRSHDPVPESEYKLGSFNR